MLRSTAAPPPPAGVWLLVGLLLLLLAIAWVASTCRARRMGRRRRPIVLSSRGSARPGAALAAATPPPTPTPELGTPLRQMVLVPLSYYAGVFELELRMGRSAIKAVFDTGSEHLVVAGTNCVLTSECSAAGGQYHEKDGKRLGRQTTVQYGTQTDTLQWYRDTVELQVAHPDRLLRTLGQESCRVEGLDDEPRHQVRLPAMDFGVVQKRSGVSNLNVFGFCQSSSPGSGLRTLLGGGAGAVFALLVSDKRGWLALGAPPPLARCPRVRRVPLVRPPPGMLGYYVVPVLEVNVWWDSRGGAGRRPGASARPRELRRCKRIPQYAIIDTGSNMLSVREPLLREIKSHGLSTLSFRRRLQIVLGHRDAPLVLDYKQREYCMGGELLVRDNLPFTNDEPVLLLGTLFMRNRYIEFDLGRRTLGVSRLQGTKPCPVEGCPAPVMRTVRPTTDSGA